MRCIEPLRVRITALAVVAVVAAVAVLAGCAPAPPRPAAPVPEAASEPAAAAAEAAASAASAAALAASAPASSSAAQAESEPGGAGPATVERRPIPPNPRYVKLAPPPAPRSQAALRVQFAQRLVQTHPDSSYTTRPPERLLAIPVLEIELNADGSVRDVKVLRKPSTGNEATVLAIAAVKRAAPYGDVSGLPKPWRVVETFLFDDDLRFKPRTLDGD